MVRLGLWCAVWLGLLGPAAAEPYEIRDREGFGQEMTAFTVDLPPGWTASGRIAWVKPCSGNELYELILTAKSADGRSVLRVMPGHQVQWSGVSVDGTVDPWLGRMAVAQAEASRNEMRTAFRGTNCHVGKVTGTEQVLRVLVLPDRPEGAQVVSVEKDAARMAAYKATFGEGTGGLITRYDAVQARLAYDGPGGPLVERLWLAWIQFEDDPRYGFMATVPSLHFQTTAVESLTFAYAPKGREADLEAAAGILASSKVNPAWQRRVEEVRRKIAETRKAARQEEQAARDKARVAAEAARDKAHADFIAVIRGEPGPVSGGQPPDISVSGEPPESSIAGEERPESSVPGEEPSESGEETGGMGEPTDNE